MSELERVQCTQYGCHATIRVRPEHVTNLRGAWRCVTHREVAA